MSSCDTYGTQCIDTGSQLTADSVAFNDELIESGCASVQCVLDNLVVGTREHVADEDNPHKVNIDQVPHALQHHTDVSIPSPLNGQVVTWSDADAAYIATNPVTGVTDHLLLSNIGTNNHDIIDQHLANLANPHQVTAAQAGAEPANANIQAHIADVATNPHQVTYEQLGGTPPSGYNVLINGDFRINQRGFDGNWAGLTDFTFGYDRWKKQTTVLEQKIEPENLKAGESYTLHWEGGGVGELFIGDSGITGESPLTQAYTTGLGLVQVPLTATNIKLELGTVPTPFQPRTIQAELAMCQRYYYEGLLPTSIYNLNVGGGGDSSFPLSFPVSMREAPTITDSLTKTTSANIDIVTLDGPTPNGMRLYIHATAAGAASNVTFTGGTVKLDAEIA